MRPKYLPLLAALTFPGAVAAQIGQPLPQVPLTNFTATDATSLADFDGRLLLVEFFAFW